MSGGGGLGVLNTWLQSLILTTRAFAAASAIEAALSTLMVSLSNCLDNALDVKDLLVPSIELKQVWPLEGVWICGHAAVTEVKRVCNETGSAKPPRKCGNHAEILISFETMSDDRAANGSIVWSVRRPKDRLRFSATDFPVRCL